MKILALLVPFAGCGAATEPPRPAVGEGPRFTLVDASPAAVDEASTGSAQWVDVDGDGDLDLFAANGYDVSQRGTPAQADRLYLNDGRGGLTPVTDDPIVADSAPSSQATWGDYDNDGDEDAFVAVQQNRDNLLYRNEGGGRFTPVTDQVPAQDGGLTFAASWVDVDRDGHLDLYASNGGLSGLAVSALYRNRGDGTFERAPANPFTTDSAVNAGGSWADYDDDGDADLFIGRWAARGAPVSALYRNEGDWRFTAIPGIAIVTDTSYALGGAWGDYDNDGDLDLAVATQGGMSNRLFRNDGGGVFTRILEGGPHVVDGGNTFALTWADHDNDGDLDLLAVNWGAPSILYTNEGDGRFTRLGHGDLGSIDTRGAASSWGDYDGDGDLDLYIASWPDYPNGRQRNHLYRNDAPAGNRWLEVKLVGTSSNRSGIGARLTARARIDGRGVTQTREVTGSTSFRSQDPVVQHFGLGDAIAVDTLVVRWPSGIVQTLTDLEAGRVHMVHEPAR